MTLGCLLASLPGEEFGVIVDPIVLDGRSQLNEEVSRKLQDLDASGIS